MKINDAIFIMEINKLYNKENILTLSILNLKKQYHLLARKYHPDKNNSTKESTQKFKEINTAYIFLSHILNTEEKENDDLYDMINELMDIIQKSNLNGFSEFKETCYGYITDILKELMSLYKYNPSILEDIYNILNTKYFNIPNDVLDILNKTIEENLQKYNIYLINVEFSKIYNNEIYILDISDNKLYLPLWHSELQYENILIKINPIINENILIDNDNNLHIYYENKFESIIEMIRQNINTLVINLDCITIDIPINNLFIKKNQIYKIQNTGLSLINSKNIFDNSKKGDTFIHITII